MFSKAVAVWAVLVLLFVAGEHLVTRAADETGSLANCSRSEPSADAMKEASLKATLVAIQQVEQAIPGWRSSAQLYRAIGVSIALLGLLMSALSRLAKDSPQQGSENDTAPRKRTMMAADVVFVLGLVVSALTTWLQQGFATDRKGYLKSADDAVVKICEIQTQISLFRSKIFDGFEDQLNFIRDHITPLTNQLQSIKSPLLAWAPASVWDRVVYAQFMVSQRLDGFGECNLLPQAQENARNEAVDTAAYKLARDPRLKLPFPNIPNVDLAILRKYADRYGTKSEREVRPTMQGFRRFLTTISLDPTFADANIIKPYLEQSRKKPPMTLTLERINSLRASQRRRSARVGAVGFLEQTNAVPVTGGDVVLTAPDPKDGWFVFHFGFDMNPGGDGVATLKGIDIHEAGSGPPARWSFGLLHQGKIERTVSERSWDKSGDPTRCITEAPAYSFLIKAVNNSVGLTVVGLKQTVE
ncbi:MAG: hypothetical protein HY235_29160 [Acidobacteria bacterium]|nr:hypothetical protein [Acidobacteriota bacterium]